VNILPEDSKAISSVEKELPNCINPNGIAHCNILIVDKDKRFQEVITNALSHFSFRGNKLGIISVDDFDKAKSTIKSNPNIILVIYDNEHHRNDDGFKLLKFIRENLGNHYCKLIRKNNTIDPLPAFDVGMDEHHKNKSEFEIARARLIDLVYMAILTYKSDYALELNNDPKPGKDKKVVKVNGMEKDELYGILAHDLKGPIGNIKVLLDFLANEPDLVDKKSYKELMSNVKQSADSIHELLENFLFWTKLQKADIQFNPVRIDLQNLVIENINLLKSTAYTKDISLSMKLEAGSIIFGDEYMITTILRNLIYNAIKFTPEGGSIEVSSHINEKAVHVSVQDNGMGIKEENIEKLFRPEIHFSSRGTCNEKGSGIGLTLCKEFVEKNGGEISVASKINKGSTFKFTVPKWQNFTSN
jgi:signal transduction histidine kinase